VCLCRADVGPVPAPLCYPLHVRVGEGVEEHERRDQDRQQEEPEEQSVEHLRQLLPILREVGVLIIRLLRALTRRSGSATVGRLLSPVLPNGRDPAVGGGRLSDLDDGRRAFPVVDGMHDPDLGASTRGSRRCSVGRLVLLEVVGQEKVVLDLSDLEAVDGRPVGTFTDKLRHVDQHQSMEPERYWSVCDVMKV